MYSLLSVSTAVFVVASSVTLVTLLLCSSVSSNFLLLVSANSFALADAEKVGNASKLTNKVVLKTAVPFFINPLVYPD